MDSHPGMGDRRSLTSEESTGGNRTDTGACRKTGCPLRFPASALQCLCWQGLPEVAGTGNRPLIQVAEGTSTAHACGTHTPLGRSGRATAASAVRRRPRSWMATRAQAALRAAARCGRDALNAAFHGCWTDVAIEWVVCCNSHVDMFFWEKHWQARKFFCYYLMPFMYNFAFLPDL